MGSSKHGGEALETHFDVLSLTSCLWEERRRLKQTIPLLRHFCSTLHREDWVGSWFVAAQEGSYGVLRFITNLGLKTKEGCMEMRSLFSKQQPADTPVARDVPARRLTVKGGCVFNGGMLFPLLSPFQTRSS
jgi:hypothetical protein